MQNISSINSFLLVMSRRSLLGGACAVALTAGAGLELLRRRSVLTNLDREVRTHLEVASGQCDIRVVTTPAQWSRVHSLIRRDLALLPILGLDCEWVSQRGQTSPVSLLQLATVSGLCVLVRLCQMTSIPASLKLLLAQAEVYKVGVAVTDDKSRLLADYEIDVAGCVDIRHLVVNHWTHQGKLGLEGLASHILGVKMDKDWRIRASDWAAETLTQRQEEYAANDSLVGLNMTWIILSHELTMTWSLWLSSLLWSSDEMSDHTRELLDRYADLKFSNSAVKSAIRKGKEKSSSPNPKTLKLRNHETRKSDLYHNCLLQAPDGQVLCTCDTKKANWYIVKGIGYKVCDDPLTVRLKFEPSGRPEGRSGEYYLSVKQNICVVCGKDQSFLRKSIVPHEYRKYFPAVMKDHQSHDVLLMCVTCHQKSNLYDADVRRFLADLCDAPIGTEADVRVRANVDLKRVKSAGRALKCNAKIQDLSKKIPDKRLNELEDILKEHYQVAQLTEDVIDQAANCDFNEENEEYVPHSRAVVQHYLERGGLIQLEVLWRRHFLEKMRPQHLPPLWSVDHQEERLGVKAADNRIDMDQYKLATEGVDPNQVLDLEAYRARAAVQLGINPKLTNNNDKSESDED